MAATLHETWLQTVRAAPAATALIESGRVWTRAELADAADAWRAALPEEVARELSRRVVLIAEPNGARWLQAFLGLLGADAVPAALDSNEPVAAQEAAALALGAEWIVRGGSVERIGRRGLDGAAGGPTPRGRRRKADVALLKVTSGSTGAPRAFAFTHEQMLVDGRNVCATMEIGPQDVNLAAIPFGHSYGLGNLIVPLLAQGTAVVVAESPLPQALGAECARWRPTVFPAVPALLRGLAASAVEREALASLRVVISAGAALPAETAVAFAEKFGVRVHSFYGSSETGGICYDRSGDATLAGRSVGTPLEGVTLEFPRGRRLRVSGPAVMGRGRFSPADRAELNAHGELVLLGRAGRVVKIAGRRIDLGEIETAIRAIPGVRDAYAAPHPQRADSLAVAAATTLAATALRDALRKRLAVWKIPERVVTLSEFPLTARGKTDTRALKRVLADNKG